jgi:hypothetical protein
VGRASGQNQHATRGLGWNARSKRQGHEGGTKRKAVGVGREPSNGVYGSVRAPLQTVRVAPAIFGLVGVLLGGLLSAGVQATFGRIDASRKRRHAARLLQDETIAIIAFIELGHAGSLWSEIQQFLDVWCEQRDALAILPHKEWSTLTQLARATGAYGKDGPASDDAWQLIFERAQAASKVLGKYVD